MKLKDWKRGLLVESLGSKGLVKGELSLAHASFVSLAHALFVSLAHASFGTDTS